MGHEGPVYKASVHRDRKGSTPNVNQSINRLPPDVPPAAITHDRDNPWQIGGDRTGTSVPLSRKKTDQIYEFQEHFPARRTGTRQASYAHNIEARSPDHCCRGETISITYSVCVFVAFGIPWAVLYCYCYLSGSTIFSHILINGTNSLGGDYNVKCVF